MDEKREEAGLGSGQEVECYTCGKKTVATDSGLHLWREVRVKLGQDDTGIALFCSTECYEAEFGSRCASPGRSVFIVT